MTIGFGHVSLCAESFASILLADVYLLKLKFYIVFMIFVINTCIFRLLIVTENIVISLNNTL